MALLFGALLLSGCSHKTDAKIELERAANSVEKAEFAPAMAKPAEPIPLPQAAGETAPAPPPPPAQEMRQALAAYKAGNLEDAVIRLQKLRATPALSPEQRMALQDGIAAVMTEIYSMAAKGDSRAIAAVRQYEQMQTSRR